MEKNVLLTISGLHRDTESEHGNVETVVEAEYYKRNDSHYLLYEEMQEGFEQASKSRIKFKENLLELTRQGLVYTHMIFEQNKRHTIQYATPYGVLSLEIATGKIRLQEKEDCIRVEVEYVLEADGEPVSDSRIEITIQEQIAK